MGSWQGIYIFRISDERLQKRKNLKKKKIFRPDPWKVELFFRDISDQGMQNLVPSEESAL